MAELKGLSLGTHLEAILSEYKSRQTIYGYPQRKLYLGFSGFDFSVQFHDKVAATPLGPASGPHTQMVQNIILSFLGGGRIMELKTIQILDQLDIPRPCIDVRNVGFNVEWSQELRLQDSYREYVMAWVLLKIIEEMELLGIPKGDPFYNIVFDISVGYDLKGISSPQVHQWLENMGDASAAIEQILKSLPPKFAEYKKLDIEHHIADSVTLSTFHGCPREEIEAIVQHLISEHGFHTIVKMNPTILGYEFVKKTLHEDLGYTHIELDRAAFDNDLQFEDGVAMMKRLEKFAEKYNRKVGAKFTNTLVVKNNQSVFKDEVMYLSGAPLHLLSMNAMHRFRTAMSDRYHISFSAGIAKHNFVDAVRCNMKPITVCTDLLKTGGYTRLLDYLKNLKTAMEEADCNNLEKFLIKSASDSKVDNVFSAGVANSKRIVPKLIENPRYHFEANQKEPPKIDSHLELFDCITCNKCLPVCPNGANFSIPTGAVELTMTDYIVRSGDFIPVAGGEFVLEKENQIANLADFCNECGECDTYCPEFGGPFIEKPRFFFTQSTYEKYGEYDGFFLPTPFALTGRIESKEYHLSFNTEKKEYLWRSGEVELILDADNKLQRGKPLVSLEDQARIHMSAYYIMKTLLDGILANPDDYPLVMSRRLPLL
jgi:putative selenate reductase